jgi:hypothetical protein
VTEPALAPPRGAGAARCSDDGMDVRTAAGGIASGKVRLLKNAST